jgi:hypothetical protein
LLLVEVLGQLVTNELLIWMIGGMALSRKFSIKSRYGKVFSAGIDHVVDFCS